MQQAAILRFCQGQKSVSLSDGIIFFVAADAIQLWGLLARFGVCNRHGGYASLHPKPITQREAKQKQQNNAEQGLEVAEIFRPSRDVFGYVPAGFVGQERQ
jgi:hypothetical protein